MATAALLPAQEAQANKRNESVNRPDTPTLITQLAQFDKLLALRDEVTRGQHPRLKIASKAPAVPSPQTEVSEKLIDSPQVSQIPAESTSSLTAAAKSTLTQQAASVQKPPTKVVPATRPAVPDINPMFLEKSDTLKRAEKRLERKRVEKLLETQLHRRKLAEKRETEQHDAVPDFDVAEVLHRALDVVKPLSSAEVNAANANGSVSDSNDNNTYYSSQANDSETDDRADLRASKPCRYYFVEGRCLKGDHCDWSHDPAFKRKMQDPHAQPASKEELSGKQHRDSHSGSGRQGDSGRDREDGEVEEGSYSPPRAPPAPLAPEEVARPTPAGSHPVVVREPNSHDTALRRGSGRHTPQNGDGHIVRNHITSPLAPQPSRVSPLAVTKMTRVERVRHDAEEQSPRTLRQHESFGQSSGSEGLTVTRKRRRQASLTEGGRNVTARRQIASPGPVIKAEPVSPPPLYGHPRAYHDVQALQSPAATRLVQARPQPPRERLYVDSGGYRVVTPPRRLVSGPIDPYGSRLEPDMRRVYSTGGPPTAESYNELAVYSHDPRLGHDARGDYRLAPNSGSRRPASRATIMELDPQPPPPNYRASVQPNSTYVRREATPPAVYSPIQRELQTMGPPARRIVVDQYGTRYFETAAVPEHRPPPVTEISRMSVRPESQRRPVYRESHGPPSPTYVEYREVWPPTSSQQRAPSRALSHAPSHAPVNIVYESRVDDGYRRAGPAAMPLRGPSPPPLVREREREMERERNPHPLDRRSDFATAPEDRPLRTDYYYATERERAAPPPITQVFTQPASPPRYAEPSGAGAYPMQPQRAVSRAAPAPETHHIVRYASLAPRDSGGDMGGSARMGSNYYMPTAGRAEDVGRRDPYAGAAAAATVGAPSRHHPAQYQHPQYPSSQYQSHPSPPQQYAQRPSTSLRERRVYGYE